MKAFWTLIMALFFTTAGGAEPTPTPKDKCEKLMTATLPFAQKMLRQHGEFFPYGGALDKRGAGVAVGATDGREKPHSADISACSKTVSCKARRPANTEQRR
jgi:hypothetical protein